MEVGALLAALMCVVATAKVWRSKQRPYVVAVHRSTTVSNYDVMQPLLCGEWFMAVLRPARSLARRLIGAVVLIVVLVVVAGGALTGLRVYSHLSALKQRLDRVESLLGSQKGSTPPLELAATLRQELGGSQQDVRALQADVDPLLPLLQRLGWLPAIGPSIEAAPHLLRMADHFLSAGMTLFDGLQPVVDAVLGDSGGDRNNKLTTERLLPLVLDAQPAFVDAQDFIERAAAERAQIDSVRLVSPLARQLDRLDKYLPAVRAVSRAATVAPLVLGAVRPMTYALLAQNNDELRPTGGFITAIGILKLDQGKITRLDITDSYVVDTQWKDRPQPPEPLMRYMDAPLWVWRDSNFWPDFPTSAKAAEFFAELDLDLKVDGVIAVDQLAIKLLIGGLGSVVVPEHDNDVLTQDNVIAKIRDYWAPPPGTIEGVVEGTATKAPWLSWYVQRKQFMSYLLQAMRLRLEDNTRPVNFVQLGTSVLQALNEKHILVYLNEPLGWVVTDGANWGGAVADTVGDYLLVVDTNMGFNKANGVVTRALDYAVTIDAAGLARGRVLVSYDNPSSRATECVHEPSYEATYDLMMNRCYWNYLRVYVPDGATLMASEDGADLEDAGVEAGKQVWAYWLVIPTRSKQEVELTYYLPRPVLSSVGAAREYRLLVQKQAGTDTTSLHVSVTLPAGAKVISASPSPRSIQGNIVRFESNLATDQEFVVLIR